MAGFIGPPTGLNWDWPKGIDGPAKATAMKPSPPSGSLFAPCVVIHVRDGPTPSAIVFNGICQIQTMTDRAVDELFFELLAVQRAIAAGIFGGVERAIRGLNDVLHFQRLIGNQCCNAKTD